MTTNANPDIVNKAKAYARETIHEAWPTVNEVDELTIGMYEFDAICIDDEACPVSSVSIMHDPDGDTFALIENARPAIPPKEETPQVPAFHFDGPIDWTSWRRTTPSHIFAATWQRAHRRVTPSMR